MTKFPCIKNRGCWVRDVSVEDRDLVPSTHHNSNAREPNTPFSLHQHWTHVVHKINTGKTLVLIKINTKNIDSSCDICAVLFPKGQKEDQQTQRPWRAIRGSAFQITLDLLFPWNLPLHGWPFTTPKHKYMQKSSRKLGVRRWRCIHYCHCYNKPMGIPVLHKLLISKHYTHAVC